ncbi:2,3-bisphosphoglycerate-dependent phosphoglycerate mutase [Winogradskyella thalassocola]|uniref:2,3-bisphosphoglycerate-dependent phosphoglycerate mutase n=1 Tax=Winogradskyella thalassocola TaxID=262004 RepID=A0A1G8BCU4_9FLAO|nr:2,3-bisphosphoglycerate-dependent phosphoglycerate mutase [Winogradskyella thalassocola]SDH31057.1 2,3-bisphosphoglycerate-dependent phosphoglycerate mutase [Winogradskyella thalassocola]
MGKLILVRHGKSLWNVENIFTGWTDIDLAPEGIEEAEAAGKLIKDHNLSIVICFSSYLKRAIKTAWIILEASDMMHVNCIKSWKLNERNYGAWQGKSKDAIRTKVGEEIYWDIRRGFSTPPPPLDINDQRHPKFDSKYDALEPSLLPLSESLEDTQKRVVQYFFEAIACELVKGKTVLVSAHGNSIRALIAQIENINKNNISNVEVQTAVPAVYEFDNNLNLTNHYQLQEAELTI